VSQGTRIGQSGLEQRYDRYLRGTDGYTRVVVNALGSRDDTRRVSRRDPIQGEQLRLSLDLGLETAADDAIQRAIGAANSNLNPAKAGAYVAMNPRSGEIYALGSYPSFDANDLAKPITQKRYDELTSQANGAPLFNRAIAATYPTGSIFKPITAIATMESGVVSPDQTIVDDGEFKLGPQVWHNARDASFGALTMGRAITVSSDVFFDTLGAWAELARPGDPALGRKRLGARAPDGDRRARRVRRARARQALARQRLREVPQVHGQGARPSSDDGRVVQVRRASSGQWSAGDNVNLATGQGDLLATPLQMATAYSTLANGGTVPRPHLGAAIEDGHGRVIQEIRKSARRHVKIDQRYLDVVMGRACSARRPTRRARRPTSSRASPTRSTARPAPPSTRARPTSPGTPATCPNGSRSIVVVVTDREGRLRRRRPRRRPRG
jgi:penicillin-binding protein 2